MRCYSVTSALRVGKQVQRVSVLKPFACRGQYFHFLAKKKRTHLKWPISQPQKLEYAYNCQIRIENTLTFPNCKNIVCEYNRTDIAGENLRKIQSGSASYFETYASYAYLKGYQPDSFFYGFPKVSTVFRHSFRLLF